MTNQSELQEKISDMEPEVVFAPDYRQIITDLCSTVFTAWNSMHCVINARAYSSSTANTAIRPLSQVMISVGVQGGNSNFHSGWYCGSASSAANSAVKKSREAALLTQHLGN